MNLYILLTSGNRSDFPAGKPVGQGVNRCFLLHGAGEVAERDSSGWPAGGKALYNRQHLR
jgi:hypothetical protein